MAKKCILCEEAAQFVIRGTSDYYCYDCAVENFSDISVLEKLEDEEPSAKESPGLDSDEE